MERLTGNTLRTESAERLEIIRDIPTAHLRELVQAEKEGRLRILPASEGGTCRSCGHFKRIPGRNCGTCEVRPYYTDRRGHIDTHRGTFTPSQSRKCCKQYVPHEAAPEGGDEG